MSASHPQPIYRIIPARPQDLPPLPSIELAAARLLSPYAPESVLKETTPPQEFLSAHARGHLWVALAGDCPVGFAQVELLEPGLAHFKEIDVLPEHGRRSLGTKLVTAVCDWAACAGFAAVTLTTFRDVPFNGPFYTKLGFEEIPPHELSPVLHSILKHEAERGLDPARRVAMQRKCSPSH